MHLFYLFDHQIVLGVMKLEGILMKWVAWVVLVAWVAWAAGVLGEVEESEVILGVLGVLMESEVILGVLGVLMEVKIVVIVVIVGVIETLKTWVVEFWVERGGVIRLQISTLIFPRYPPRGRVFLTAMSA